jgi:hypothetical protein
MNVPREVAADNFVSGWSLALIGNASERSLRVEEEADPRRFR